MTVHQSGLCVLCNERNARVRWSITHSINPFEKSELKKNIKTSKNDAGSRQALIN